MHQLRLHDTLVLVQAVSLLCLMLPFVPKGKRRLSVTLATNYRD